MTTATDADVLAGALAVIHPTWHAPLAPVRNTIVSCLQAALADAAAGHRVLPHPQHVLRAFATPFAQPRVLILGQDPYPTIGHPIGLSFAVDRTVRPLPKSLVNIYTELHSDIGCPPPEHGDLSGWVDQGVMLLNRSLTVRAGAAGSHQKLGWHHVTACAVTALAQRDAPLVAILWGRPAQTAATYLGTCPRIESPHPSPLSAHRGFFGSKPFSRANAALTQAGAAPIAWEAL